MFRLKHQNADVREIGRRLNVQFVLEGSIRKTGEALRITVQLVSAEDGYQIWSRRYHRAIHDVFAIQDEIAHEIARLLPQSTLKAQSDSPAVRPASYEAYVWYLRGRYHLNRQTSPSFRKAIKCFERAIEQSPNYAAAFSGAAMAWLYLGHFAMSRPFEAMPIARDFANRALEINGREAEALSVVACFKAMFDWDWSGAEQAFRNALSLKKDAGLYAHLTMFALLPLGRISESLAMLEEARRADPLSLFVSASRGAVLLVARRPQEAEPEYRRALELDPDFWRAIVGLGRCYEARGSWNEAIACFERARVVSAGVPSAIGALGRAYAIVGRRKDAELLLAELDTIAQDRYVSPYGRVLIHLGLGDDQVFQWLGRTCDDRAAWLMYLATDPRFDHLRDDPRFRAVLRRLNLPLIDQPVQAVETVSNW